MTGREEKLVVRAERESRDGVGVGVDGGSDGGIGGVDDLDDFAARARHEGAVGGHRQRPAGVELLQRRHAAVVPLRSQRRHSRAEEVR